MLDSSVTMNVRISNSTLSPPCWANLDELQTFHILIACLSATGACLVSVSHELVYFHLLSLSSLESKPLKTVMAIA